MAVHDYTVNVTFGGAADVLRPGDSIELDAAVDDRWAAVITAGWITQTTSDAINEPDEPSNPDWTDPTP